MDVSSKNIYKWPTNIWKDTQHHLQCRKCKLKPQWDSSTYSLGWLWLKKQKITSAGKDVGKLESLYTASGNVKETATVGYRTENRDSNRHKCASVHSSTIHSSQNVEITHVINWWLDSHNVVYIYSGILLSYKKEWNFDVCYNMNGPWKQYSRLKKILHDPTNMWYLELANSERRKVEFVRESEGRS